MGALVLLGALTLVATLARAGPADDCNQVRDLDRQIRGCTDYIKSGGAPQNLATAYLNRANAYALRRRYHRAFADFGAAIKIDPQNPLAYYNRGNAYLDTGQDQRAIADYQKAIELEPEFALAYYNRGLAHERRGDARAAEEDYRQALSLDPTAEKARRRLKRLQPE